MGTTALAGRRFYLPVELSRTRLLELDCDHHRALVDTVNLLECLEAGCDHFYLSLAVRKIRDRRLPVLVGFEFVIAWAVWTPQGFSVGNTLKDLQAFFSARRSSQFCFVPNSTRSALSPLYFLGRGLVDQHAVV